ncbi:MAG TPA: hypothetical protein VK886_16515 [Vicinamibacterales bacterium]|nr:hypothetical protein [Vicinamibacterales bacterium]
MTPTRITAVLVAATLVHGVLAPAAAASTTDYGRIRAKLAAARAPELVVSPGTLRGVTLAPARRDERRDSVWNGLLIGAGIGLGAGLLWGKSLCPNDDECLAITMPVGGLAGLGIGAAAGAIVDALSH